MVALATGPRVESPAVVNTEHIRRFTLADITLHGQWLLKRLRQAYPTHSERSLLGWLRGLNEDNSNLFLAADFGAALFETTSMFRLSNKPIVIERFVWAMEGHVAEGAEFYVKAAEWAKSQSIEQLIVEEMTDIPHEMIRDKLGRLFTRQQVFARL